MPAASRHITLQRGKIDYWQNMQPSADSMLTSSCQNHIGSASNLLSLSFDPQSPDMQAPLDPNGQIISITTSKHRQPSVLNQSQNIQWNIDGDGKQLRYSSLKWHSVDQLSKVNRPTSKQRTKRKDETLQQHVSDSATDTGSSSEPHNLSAPPVLLRTMRSPVASPVPKGKQNLDSFIRLESLEISTERVASRILLACQMEKC